MILVCVRGACVRAVCVCVCVCVCASGYQAGASNWLFNHVGNGNFAALLFINHWEYLLYSTVLWIAQVVHWKVLFCMQIWITLLQTYWIVLFDCWYQGGSWCKAQSAVFIQLDQ